MKVTIHAAKIPEAIQARGKFERMLAGDMVYVNACDDKPWKDLSKTVNPIDLTPCPACQYIVAVNRKMNPQ